VRFRRAKAILAYWREGRLCFDNYLTRVSVAADQTTLQILNFFDRWRRPDELCALFPEYTPASVRHAVQQLVAHTLLVREGTPQAKQDAHVAKVWSRWLPEGSFHFATKDAQYINPEWGLAYLKSILPKTPQPAFFKSYRNAAHVELPPRELSDSEFLRVLMTRRTQREFSSKRLPLEALSQLLSLTWGVTGYRATPLFGDLPLKTSPSGGARHPGEVYLVALRVEGLAPGLYHYHPVHHRLETIRKGAMQSRAFRYCAGQTHAKNAAALFLMTAVFERSMWKYHMGRAYRVVTLDAGHLCQTLCLVATWLGLAPFCTAALKDTLIEQDLGIDGIRESVLYVAGVGLPLASERM